MKVAPTLHQSEELNPTEPAPVASNVIRAGIQHRNEYRHAFKHEGRRYVIFKRDETPLGSYYIHVQHGKRRHKKSLETCEKSAAIHRAKMFLKAILGQRWADLDTLAAKGTTPSTVGDVLYLYPTVAMIAPRSIRNNMLAFRQVLRTVLPSVSNVDLVPLSAVDASVAHRFQELTVQRYAQAIQERLRGVGKAEGAPISREVRERALRSSRSILQQARSVFNRMNELPAKYAKEGLIIPECVAEFAGCRLQGRMTKTEYNAPSDDIVRKSFETVNELRNTDTECFLAFWFAVGAGLRRGEIRSLDWSHVIERKGAWWISGGIGKDGERIEVQIQTKAVEALRPFRQQAGKVLPSKGIEWAKRLNAWMRHQGWYTEKKMHELRAYVGSLIYRKDPVAAMRFMRHSSFKMTEQFYVRYGQNEGKQVDVL